VEPSPAEQSVPRLSLRNKLLAFAFALVVLPGAVLASLALRDASAALEAQVGGSLAREASHRAELLEALLRSERQTLEAFARQDLMRDVRVGDVDKRVAMALAALRQRPSVAPRYLVLDGAGSVIAASGAEEQSAGAALLSGRAELFAMRTAIPDPDDARRSLGTLYAVYAWADLARIASAAEHDLRAQGLAARVLLTTRDGTPLGAAGAAAADDAAAQEGGRAAPDAVLRGAAPAAGAPLAAHDWLVDAAHGLIVGRALLHPGDDATRILVIVPRADALAPVASLRRRMALTLGAALALALLLAWLASRRVGRPLSELTRAIRSLARREPGAQQRVPVRSADELGALAGAFNAMSADLDRAQRELVEAEKFAFVGELAAGVAHEIRTSLGVLKSSSQLLDRALPADASGEARELAQMVREEVGRLGGVVDDLLTLKPEHALRLEPGPLAPLLARAAEFAEHAARAKGVRVVGPSAPGPEPPVLRAAELVQRVAVNLLINAVQALAAGGTVELALLPARNGYAGFEVRDDGPGIPEELRERIFQPFVTGRSGGVGLGLTFVKRVVHEHKGRIALDSAPGRGTRVRIELPLAEPAP
jgi:signal transduction histidine kinase